MRPDRICGRRRPPTLADERMDVGAAVHCLSAEDRNRLGVGVTVDLQPFGRGGGLAGAEARVPSLLEAFRSGRSRDLG